MLKDKCKCLCMYQVKVFFFLDTAAVISLFFLKVLFGGMALGYMMGKFCSAWLARIFNDAVVETIITIAFPYITYFIGVLS